MELPNYIQIIKTKDAELRGFRNLSPSVKQHMLPLFELTRSRKTKTWPDGDIFKRIDEINECVGERPFILDLTSDEDLINPQIEDLFDEENGFKAWFEFIESINSPNVIPVVHAYEDGDPGNISLLSEKLSNKFPKIAFRVPIDDENVDTYLRAIQSGLNSPDQLILIIDAGSISEKDYDQKKLLITRMLESPNFKNASQSISVCASSFPSYVMDLPKCYDKHGEIDILEWSLFQELRQISNNLIYGDYGSIYPGKTQGRGGAWVPRIDYSLSKTSFYTRYRRHEGGYVKAAQELVENPNYDALDCWGKEEIENAVAGKPSGISPSFWISVRLNIHTTRKVADLAHLKGNSSG